MKRVADEGNKNTPPPKKLPVLLSKYKSYLKKKNLDKKTITSCIQRINTILKEMGTDNYRQLFKCDDVGRILKKLRSRQTNKKLSFQTQRMYLSALKHLCLFFKMNSEFDRFITLPKIDIMLQGLEDLSKSKKK